MSQHERLIAVVQLYQKNMKENWHVQVHFLGDCDQIVSLTESLKPLDLIFTCKISMNVGLSKINLADHERINMNCVAETVGYDGKEKIVNFAFIFCMSASTRKTKVKEKLKRNS